MATGGGLMTKLRTAACSRAICIGVATALMAAVVLSACGSSDSGSTAGTSESSAQSTESSGSSEITLDTAVDGNGMNIAWLDVGSGNALVTAALRAAEGEADKSNVSLTPFSAEFEPGKQTTQCQDAINSGRYEAIIAIPVDGPSFVTCATAAEKAGIPLIIWYTPAGNDTSNVESLVPGVTSQILVPLKTVMEGWAEEVGAACKGIDPCNIAEFSVIQQIPVYQTTFEEALKPVLESNPNMKVVSSTPLEEIDIGSGEKAMQDVLAKGEDINVVTTGGPSIIGAIKAYEAAGNEPGVGPKDVRFISERACTAVLDYVRDGKMWSSGPSFPEEEAVLAVKVAVLAAQGEEVAKGYNSAEIAGLPVMFNNGNIAKYPDFKGQWEC
jgi:ribose transport system substrate-binding protein